MSDIGANDKPASSQTESRLPTSSPGARLAALRKERGWTVEQVASQLNLAPRQIQAIERDDYPALPGMAVARGFVRAYAKLLKTDPVPLLTDIGGEAVLVPDPLVPQKSLSAPFAGSRLPSMTDRPGLSSKWVIGLLLLGLLAAGIWASREGMEQAGIPSATTSAAKDEGASMAGGNSATPSTESNRETILPSPSVPDVNAPAPETLPDTATPALTPDPAAPVAVAPVQAAPQDTPPASGKDTFQLKVRENSWIEIRRSGDNSVVLSRTLKPGETESVEIAEPMSVVIGNASGVDAVLRGSPLELKVNSKSNVARLNLK